VGSGHRGGCAGQGRVARKPPKHTRYARDLCSGCTQTPHTHASHTTHAPRAPTPAQPRPPRTHSRPACASRTWRRPWCHRWLRPRTPCGDGVNVYVCVCGEMAGNGMHVRSVHAHTPGELGCGVQHVIVGVATAALRVASRRDDSVQHRPAPSHHERHAALQPRGAVAQQACDQRRRALEHAQQLQRWGVVGSSSATAPAPARASRRSEVEREPCRARESGGARTERRRAAGHRLEAAQSDDRGRGASGRGCTAPTRRAVASTTASASTPAASHQLRPRPPRQARQHQQERAPQRRRRGRHRRQ
jgi:hypothetical protein